MLHCEYEMLPEAYCTIGEGSANCRRWSSPGGRGSLEATSSSWVNRYVLYMLSVLYSTPVHGANQSWTEPSEAMKQNKFLQVFPGVFFFTAMQLILINSASKTILV